LTLIIVNVMYKMWIQFVTYLNKNEQKMSNYNLFVNIHKSNHLHESCIALIQFTFLNYESW